ncbi:MAG: hypothetical protein Kow0067_07190 [Coriobacteriia bacterium]
MFAEPTGFALFWQNTVLTYVAPILQMLLWVVQGVVLVWAALLFRRFVMAKTGGATSAEKEAEPVIRVDEFVE